LALMLAGIGIYGTVAYSVARRTAELGLRVALGATPPRVLWLVARRGVAVIVGGIAIGTIAAFSTSRLLTEVLFGLSPGDPRVYATAAVAEA
jgi:ABC-type antimicrobial peptide transport system permease subunit